MNYLCTTTLLSSLSYCLPLILCCSFYCVVIYLPLKKQRNLLLKLAIGKKIVTEGGLCGTIVLIEKEYCIIALENNAHARVTKNSIYRIS